MERTVIVDHRREAWLLKIIRNRAKPWMWPPYLCLRLLSILYRLGWSITFRKRKRIAKTRIEGAKIIGVGNITLGGSGKTPVAAYLAQTLAAGGHRVGIALKGYKRRGDEDVVVIEPDAGGEKLLERAGDEAVLLSRSVPTATVGVGSDRAAVAQKLVSSAGADIVILDDAFQFITLHRDLNILVMDATCPFGFNALVPAGTLREPISGINRADLIWITRSDQAPEREINLLRQRLRSRFPGVPFLFSRHAAVRIKKIGNDEPISLDCISEKTWVLAAGIGNPESFRRSVEKLGGKVAAALWFPDHHEYGPDDVREMLCRRERTGAHGIITTEKDEAKLARLVDDPELFNVLGVGIELDRESEANLVGTLERIV